METLAILATGVVIFLALVLYAMWPDLKPLQTAKLRRVK